MWIPSAGSGRCRPIAEAELVRHCPTIGTRAGFATRLIPPIDARTNDDEHLQPSRSWNAAATQLNAVAGLRRHARA
jgi:hypothetical protein